MKSPLYEFEGILIHETEKAILVNAGIGENIWIPKSVCEWEVNPGKSTITVTLPQNWAEYKGII